MKSEQFPAFGSVEIVSEMRQEKKSAVNEMLLPLQTRTRQASGAETFLFFFFDQHPALHLSLSPLFSVLL